MLLRCVARAYQTAIIGCGARCRIAQYSRLCKAELTGRLADVYCQEELIMERMTCLTDRRIYGLFWAWDRLAPEGGSGLN